MHTRQKIRNAVYQKLQAHPSLKTLFNTRTKATNEDKLPFGNVVAESESVDDLSDQFQEFRTLQLQVELYVKDSDNVADALDLLAVDVEALLATDQTLGGICSSLRYKGFDADLDSAAEQEAARMTLKYECKYVWAPEPGFGELGTIQVSIDMSGPRNEPQLPSTPDGQIDAVDTITLPQ